LINEIVIINFYELNNGVYVQKYLDALRETVCSICVDSNKEGICNLSEHEICAIENHLEEIVQLVHNTEVDYYDKYYELLREKICVSCREGNGKCIIRDDANCALDRYFPIIVETIRKVEKEN